MKRVEKRIAIDLTAADHEKFKRYAKTIAGRPMSKVVYQLLSPIISKGGDDSASTVDFSRESAAVERQA